MFEVSPEGFTDGCRAGAGGSKRQEEWNVRLRLPSLAGFRASAVAYNTNPTGRRCDSKSSPPPIAPCRATATASLRRQPLLARAMR